jgi:septal ring-binding cell division protein DamX
MNTICPLCRRVSADGGGPSPVTRLCAGCRSLVQAAFPGTATVALPSIRQTYMAADTLDGQSGAPGDFFLRGEDAPRVQVLEIDDDFDLVDEQAQRKSDLPLGDNDPIGEVDLAYELDLDDERRAEGQIEAGPLGVRPDAEQVETRVEDQAAHQTYSADSHKGATDPWDDPLPAWDYSQNEWPMIVTDERPSLLTRMRTPLTVALLLASLAAFYFLVYRPLTDPSIEIEAQSAAAGPVAAAESNPQPQKSADLPASAQSQKDAAPASAAASTAPPASSNNTQAPYTLQAAALPDEASAKVFSEKLIRVGVPSYVVVADRGERKFFRVRVGRFATSDEAQRYATQSRQRARAAGVNIDLIVVSNDK